MGATGRDRGVTCDDQNVAVDATGTRPDATGFALALAYDGCPAGRFACPGDGVQLAWDPMLDHSHTVCASATAQPTRENKGFFKIRGFFDIQKFPENQKILKFKIRSFFTIRGFSK